MTLNPLDVLKGAASLYKEAGKIEEYKTILELMDDLIAKRGEILDLKEQLNDLQAKLQIKDDYIFKNQSYWHRETDDGPYCPRCFDKNIALMRMIETYNGSNDARCPECRTISNFTGKANPSGLSWGSTGKSVFDQDF